MENQNWTPEAEKKEKKARRIALLVIAVAGSLFVAVFLVLGAVVVEAVRTFSESLEEQLAEEKSSMDSYLAERLEQIEKTEALVKDLGTGYDWAWPITEESNICLVKKDGKWGLVSVTGEVVVPLEYDRYSYMDNTGWVEFERNGKYSVFDEKGHLVRIYKDKLAFRMESEEAYLYRTAKAYMSGLELTTTIPEILEDDYYGVKYYNWETAETLYSAVGNFDEVGIFTFPDETGRAVAIQSNGLSNTIYYITEDGCESRVMELPEGINGRWFDFPGDYTWADIALSNGWLKVYVCDAVPGFLLDEYEYYLAFLNVDTLELVPFPEEYQTYFTIYDMGYRDAMAIRLYNEDVDYYQYALCKGDKKLTEEIYYWVEFGEKYMVAGQKNGVDVINYDGEVLATYWDVSGSFVNGKTLVWDRSGVYFIDENLKRCSDYLFDGQIDGCFPRGVIIDDLYYMLDEFAG